MGFIMTIASKPPGTSVPQIGRAEKSWIAATAPREIKCLRAPLVRDNEGDVGTIDLLRTGERWNQWKTEQKQEISEEGF